MSRVCVVGLGYVGLSSAAILARSGHQVVGCDTNAAIVAGVNAGQAHFEEPDLQALLAGMVQAGALRAQAMPAQADYFLLAVPTPFLADKSPDLRHLHAAADSIAPLLQRGNTVIVESTCPVGATEALAARLAAARPDLGFPILGGAAADIHIAHCPERVLPGQVLRELVANDRIIGGMTPACAQHALALYRGFAAGACHLTDCRTAEFVKLAENASRDVNIAFANELSLIAERLNVDVWQAIALANHHPRVAILRPGAGVGGHCIAVDPWFLVDAAPDIATLLRAARTVNDAKPDWVIDRIRALAARLRAPAVACLGLAYKADVGDLRESPALRIAATLARDPQLRLLVAEPHLTALPAALAGLPNVALTSAEQACAAADVIAILVPHTAFRALDRELLRQRMVVDAVGLLH